MNRPLCRHICENVSFYVIGQSQPNIWRPASHQSKQILRFSCEPNVFIAPDWESLHVFVFQHHTLITYLSDLKSDNGWKKLVDYCTSFNGLSLVSKSSFDTCCTCISHMQASYPVWDSVSVFIKIYELFFVIYTITKCMSVSLHTAACVCNRQACAWHMKYI